VARPTKVCIVFASNCGELFEPTSCSNSAIDGGLIAPFFELEETDYPSIVASNVLL
jgi:hypothetical protein